MKHVMVRTQDLKKYYQTGNQTVKALDGVNFEVAEREFVSIIGKSGSGKSTLLHMIGGAGYAQQRNSHSGWGESGNIKCGTAGSVQKEKSGVHFPAV